MEERSLENRALSVPLPACPSPTTRSSPSTSALAGGPGPGWSSATPAVTTTGEGARDTAGAGRGREGGLWFQFKFPWAFDLIFFSLPPRLPNSTAPMSASPVHWGRGLA